VHKMCVIPKSVYIEVSEDEPGQDQGENRLYMKTSEGGKHGRTDSGFVLTVLLPSRELQLA